MTNLKTPIKVILALGLLVPFLNPPYGFYQILRICVTCGLAYLIYKPDNQKFSKLFMTSYIVGCVLFQPFEKIIFEKDVWLIIDSFFALILMLDVIFNLKTKKNE
mgnify:CR=1 FL=1